MSTGWRQRNTDSGRHDVADEHPTKRIVLKPVYCFHPGPLRSASVQEHRMINSQEFFKLQNDVAMMSENDKLTAPTQEQFVNILANQRHLSQRYRVPGFCQVVAQGVIRQIPKTAHT